MNIYDIKEKVIGIILLSVFSVICVFAIFLICAFATNPIIYSIMACLVFGFLENGVQIKSVDWNEWFTEDECFITREEAQAKLQELKAD